jgi:hypothetical protein
MSDKPNPGSQEAIYLGCICPVIDNHYGKGVETENGEVHFWYTAECPVHQSKIE